MAEFRLEMIFRTIVRDIEVFLLKFSHLSLEKK